MNRSGNETTYSDIRMKQVVDYNDGKNLGHICDMVFSSDLTKVVGVIAPYGKRGLIGKSQEIFIPLRCIKNIGEDVIIVDIGCNENPKPPKKEECEPKPIPPVASENSFSAQNQPKCDGRCDKCMLFDCQFRWKGKAF